MSLLEFACHHRFPGGFELDVEFTTDSLVTALWGPSGAGKTTVLGVIAGLLRPHTGRVSLGLAGESTAANRLQNALTLIDTHTSIWLPPERRGVGYVFQDHLLFPHLRVVENLRFGMPRDGGRPRLVFADVVDRLELSPLLERFPRQLSGGESQRVALGRALLSHPHVLLMDEPLASLDEALKQKILEDLARIVADWRIPLVYVSHVEAEVRRLAGTVVRLERGRVIGIDRTDAHGVTAESSA